MTEIVLQMASVDQKGVSIEFEFYFHLTQRITWYRVQISYLNKKKD